MYFYSAYDICMYIFLSSFLSHIKSHSIFLNNTNKHIHFLFKRRQNNLPLNFENNKTLYKNPIYVSILQQQNIINSFFLIMLFSFIRNFLKSLPICISFKLFYFNIQQTNKYPKITFNFIHFDHTQLMSFVYPIQCLICYLFNAIVENGKTGN